jgi:hypothetical protein
MARRFGLHLHPSTRALHDQLLGRGVLVTVVVQQVVVDFSVDLAVFPVRRTRG